MGAKANTLKCLQQHFAYTGDRTLAAFAITTSKTVIYSDNPGPSEDWKASSEVNSLEEDSFASFRTGLHKPPG